LKFTKERNKFRLGENEVVLSREDFTKYKTNIDGNKKFDKPKNYKKSERIKKLKKKIHDKRKKKRLRVPPRK
ncbi:MAG TPA: hypothetical protein VGK25_02590, partial [Ignavibacteria bacterium]